MLPILLELGPIKIYSMGVFLVLALFWSSFFLWKVIKLTAYKEEEVFDGMFISIFGGLFFARLVYVATHFSDFGLSIPRFILINGYPGLSLFGGIFGAIGVFYLYCKIKRYTFRELIDYGTPSLFLGLALGKIGAFLSGSEVGTETNFFLSVIYAGHEGTRHITALYEALIFAIAAFVAHRILMATRRGSFFRGFNYVFFLLCFSLVHVLLDFFREDHIYLARLSLNVIVGVAVATISIGYLLFRYRSELGGGAGTFFKKFTKKNANTHKKSTGRTQGKASH